MERVYACIDLKSFYASVECVARGLDPMTARLVVADPARGGGTICLAVSPAMKALGVRNRCRVFEIPKNISYIMAPPRMRLYMETSAKIYEIYLKYISHDDIHVYSVDECFFDLTPYRKLYHKDEWELAKLLMDAVLVGTGLYSTAGIGTNLFLAKVALDIMAKKSPTRIGYLDEAAFTKEIAHHRPITDVWNVGPGIAARLSHLGVYDLAGVTRLPEATLYREFGVNAEYLIDHAHGRESCTLADIRAYRPEAESLSNGQVLFSDYPYEKAKLVLDEMIENTVFDLIAKERVTSSVSLTVGYADRLLPPVGGSKRLGTFTDSYTTLKKEIFGIYARVVNPELKIRRLGIAFGALMNAKYLPIDFFTDAEALTREQELFRAMLKIREKYGCGAILRGSSFEEGATARERARLIGGHRA